MQLFSKVRSLLGKKEPQQEHFLALILKERAVKAVIWGEKDGQVAVVDQGMVKAEKNLDALEPAELLPLVDQAIGIAEKTLPQSVKTTKTIFGLNEWWVGGTTISQPYMGKIKRLSKELDLTPLGFVVIPEAIAHQLKLEEGGSPPTALLVSVGTDVIGVTLVRAGRIEASKTTTKEGKSDSETAAAIIRSFGDVEILPSRILLFDGEVSLEEAKQEFIAYPWTKQFSFLHFPKIDILPTDLDARAVVSGAAKEMGFSLEESEKEAAPPSPAQAEEKPQLQEEEEVFGFAKDRDIVEEALDKEDQLEDDEEERIKPTTSAAVLPKPPLDLPAKTKKLPSITITPIFSFFASLGSMMRSFIPSATIPSGLPMTRRLWLPLAILVVLLFLFLSIFIFVPTATVTLVAQARVLENDVQVTIDSNVAGVDKEKKIIPAQTVETKQEGKKTTEATGKKTIGEKAKGEVTIYNKTENRKTFPKGTLLLGPSELRFTLNDDVTVASTSAFELTPSSVKVKVTADQIGEESNVPANTNFPFKEFPTSSYFAKNDGPFTGGTKKEVTVVSKDDQDTLLTALTEELRSKAKEDLASKSGGNEIVDIDMKEETGTKKFSKNVDDESDKIELSLSMSFSTLAYKNSDLLELTGSKIESDVPAGFTFQKDKFETSVKNVQKDKKGIPTVVVHYKATLIPNLDPNRIRNDIVGKSKPAVEAYLKSLPLADFTISQSFEFLTFNLLPQRGENIKIEVQSR